MLRSVPDTNMYAYRGNILRKEMYYRRSNLYKSLDKCRVSKVASSYGIDDLLPYTSFIFGLGIVD